MSEEEHEVTLAEERVVVEKETVPVERVRLTTETETSEAAVDEQLRKERIAAEGDIGDRDR
jgi:stress response protein YsnF